MYFALIVFIGASCKKEEAIIDEIPEISLLVGPPSTVAMGESFDFEGNAKDKEGLSRVFYEIVTPNCSYLYRDSGSFVLDGTYKLFSETISIAPNSSIGPAIFKIFAIDTAGNWSEFINREFTIIDTILAHSDQLIDQVNYADSIQVYFHRNTYNICDSVTIYNHTTSEVLGHASDAGGFFDLRFAIKNTIENQYVFFNIYNTTATSVYFEIPASISNPTNFPFEIILREYKDKGDENALSFDFGEKASFEFQMN